MRDLRTISYYGTSTPDASIPGTPSSTPRRISASTPSRRAADSLAATLFRAAEAGDAPLTEQALSNLGGAATGIALLLDPASGSSVLHAACTGGNPEIVELLLKQKANPEARNKSRATPLHFAATKGKHKAVVKLIEVASAADADDGGATPGPAFQSNSGVDVNASDIHGCTPLHAAAAHGHVQVIEVLVAHGAKVNVGNICGATPLHYATSNGQEKAARRLLRKHAALEARDSNQCTALHLAAFYGHAKVGQLLISAGADTAAKDTAQMTPLDTAVAGKSTEMCSLLEAARAIAAKANGAKLLQFLVDTFSSVGPDEPLTYGAIKQDLVDRFGEEAFERYEPEVNRMLVAHAASGNVGGRSKDQDAGDGAAVGGDAGCDNANDATTTTSASTGFEGVYAALAAAAAASEVLEVAVQQPAKNQLSADQNGAARGDEELPDLNDLTCISTAQEAADLGLALATNKTVQVLDLAGSNFGAGGFLYLADALKSNKSVRSLNLSGAVRNAADMTALAAALVANITLHSLDLSQAVGGTAGLRALGAALAENNTLQRLILTSAITSGGDMAELAAGLSSNLGLLELDLSNSKFTSMLGLFGTNGTKHLGTCLRGNRTLQSLALVGSLQTTDEAAELASALETCASLTNLDLRNCLFNRGGIDKLVKALTLCPRIVDVQAESDLLKPLLRARKVFRAIQQLTAEETLAVNLDSCIDVAGAEPAALLFAIEQNSAVESLSIQSTMWGLENTQELLSIVSESPRLTTLNISHCFTSSTEAMVLAEFLRTNKTLTCLTVRGTLFNVPAMKALVHALKCNDTLTKLRVDPSADVLQPFAYFNDGMCRIKSADPEDLNDLMFEAIRLEKTHRIQALLDAGASASARDRASGRLPHSLLLATEEPADFPLLALFRAHWEIDLAASKLLMQHDAARAVFKRLVLALVHEGWKSLVSGDNVMHCVLKACMDEMITSAHAEDLCQLVQEKRSGLLEQQNYSGLSVIELATQCSRGLRLLFAADIIKMVQTWTRASLDRDSTHADSLQRSASVPAAAPVQKQRSDDSFG